MGILEMKWWLVVIACMLSGVVVTACASAGKHTSPASRLDSTRHYLNDGDAENVNDHDDDNGPGNHDDTDDDSFKEYDHTYDNGGYHDGDDRGVLGYGHAASASDERAITVLVERFYAAARAEAGATACSSMVSSVAAAVPEDYGRSSGPAYLRGGKTCEAVMSRMFKHMHGELAGAVIVVTGVRVSNDEGVALLGSTTLPASEIYVRRGHGVWQIDAVSGRALP
jgi:hypothetical protein